LFYFLDIFSSAEARTYVYKTLCFTAILVICVEPARNVGDIVVSLTLFIFAPNY